MGDKILEQLKNWEGKKVELSKSAAGVWLEYYIEKIESGEAAIWLHVKNEMTNPLGNLHGGMIAMIMDEICGLAHLTLGKETFYTTVNISVDFLWSAALGEKIFAKGKVIRSGKKIANIEGEIFNENKECIARATTNLVNTDKLMFDILLK